MKTIATTLMLSLALACGAAQAKTLAEIHGSMWPAEGGWVNKATCQGCHGSYADLAKKTEKLKPNPHASHLGEVDCQACHKGSTEPKAPQLMCNDCHKFKIEAR